MKKIITLILLVPTLALADQPLGFTDFSHYLQSKFSEFKNSPQVGYVRYGSPALSARIEEQNNQYQQQYAQTNGRFSYNQLAKFPAGNSRNFVENQMMNQIGTLAQTLAQNA